METDGFECVSFATGLLNMLYMTDYINFHFRGSKLRVTRYPYGSRDKVEMP